MAWKTVYATALAAALATFAMAGGIRASEKAAVAVERQDARASVPATIHPVDSHETHRTPGTHRVTKG